MGGGLRWLLLALALGAGCGGSGGQVDDQLAVLPRQDAPSILGEDDDPAQCLLRRDTAGDYVQQARDERLACDDDHDCTTVSLSTGCEGTCPAVVNVAGRYAVDEARHYADATWCQGYRADGCLYATALCLLVRPYCDAGTCRGQPILP